MKPNALAPKVRHSIAQGATLGIGRRCVVVALKGRHSPAAPFDAALRGPRLRSGAEHAMMTATGRCAAREWRPVGANGPFVPINPGFRCAAPWAIEYDPFGVGGLRPLFDLGLTARSTEGASFDSPGCNPGLSSGSNTLALKGRHSLDAPFDAALRGPRLRSGAEHAMMTATGRCAAREWRPVGANGPFVPINPGFRCAAPWAIECDPVGVGGLRPLFDLGLTARSTEGASFDSPGCNPGLSSGSNTLALKGRHSPAAPFDAALRGPRLRSGAEHAMVTATGRCAAREWRPVGANDPLVPINPGFRCAAPWAIEYDPVGVGGLRPLFDRFAPFTW